MTGVRFLNDLTIAFVSLCVICWPGDSYWCKTAPDRGVEYGIALKATFVFNFNENRSVKNFSPH